MDAIDFKMRLKLKSSSLLLLFFPISLLLQNTLGFTTGRTLPALGDGNETSRQAVLDLEDAATTTETVLDLDDVDNRETTTPELKKPAVLPRARAMLGLNALDNRQIFLNLANAPPPVNSRSTSNARPQNKIDFNPLQTTCSKELTGVDHHNLKCYHCRSSTAFEKEPKCDSLLWRYLKNNERATYRVSCDTSSLQGKFCVKIVKQKYKERITERGCYQDVIKKSDGTVLKTMKGCYSFKKDGYLTKVCFCDRSFCNAAHPQLRTSPKLFTLTVIVSFMLFFSD